VPCIIARLRDFLLTNCLLCCLSVSQTRGLPRAEVDEAVSSLKLVEQVSILLIQRVASLAPARCPVVFDSPVQATPVDLLLGSLGELDAMAQVKATAAESNCFHFDKKIKGVAVKDPLDPNSNSVAMLVCFETMIIYTIPLRLIVTRGARRVVVENVRSWLPACNAVRASKLANDPALNKYRCKCNAAGAERMLTICAAAAATPPVGTELPPLPA
jgi:hypothetical protein